MILHIWHGALPGITGAYGHYLVAKGTASGGYIATSDPDQPDLGIYGYTRSELQAAMNPNFDNQRALIIWYNS